MVIAFDSMIAWFLVSVFVIIVTLITSYTFTRRSRELSGELRKIATENSEEVEKIIRERLSPTIHLHDGLDAVTKRAAHVIGEVATYETSSERLIEFFGAASLAATEADVNPTSAEPDTEQKTPSRLYREAIEAATTKNVRMKRYISLFTETQLRERGLA